MGHITTQLHAGNTFTSNGAQNNSEIVREEDSTTVQRPQNNSAVFQGTIEQILKVDKVSGNQKIIFWTSIYKL